MKDNISQPKNGIKCWDCCYCDKESVLVNGKWLPTRTGYCLAQNSAVNGDVDFYITERKTHSSALLWMGSSHICNVINLKHKITDYERNIF